MKTKSTEVWITQKIGKEGKRATPTWLLSVDIAGVHR